MVHSELGQWPCPTETISALPLSGLVLSQQVLTASGTPLSPSQTTINTSRTPRFLISIRARSQNLADHVHVADLHPNRVENTTGYTGSSGWFCLSAMNRSG